MALIVEQASEGEKPIMERLLQLYLHDFSEFADIASPFGEIGADGTFGYWHFDSYWTDRRREALLARLDGKIVGFVLIHGSSATGQPVDYCIAEFFILRKYRGAGFGERVAEHVIADRPGTWEIPVAAYNKPALAFWRKAVAEMAGRVFEEIEGDGQRWIGTILRSEQRMDGDAA
ncbi:MAG: GNAT family N-acetyltransferase [Pseudomonadota bacterium]